MEVCLGKVDCQCLSSDIDMLSPFKSRACSDGHRTSSEASNILSACSSHDSFSENVESKANLRVYDTSGIASLSKGAACETVAKDSGLPEPQILCVKRIFSNQQKRRKVVEFNGDNISCVSGTDSQSMMVNDHKRGDADRKNAPCSSASATSSLLEGFEKEVKVQSASYCQHGSNYEVEERQNCSLTPTKFAKGSLVEAAPFSDKSNPSEISSSRAVSACGASTPKGHLSDCSMEQVESAFVKEATFGFDGDKHDVIDSAESVKPKTEVDMVDQATEAVKCSLQNEDMVSLKVSNVQQTPVQSQPVDCLDGSDVLEDVKVCDICGDAGREELLAICTKCSDGAEHIYCMRIQLDKVPESNWMCEECMLHEENEKQKENKFGKIGGVSKCQSLNDIQQSVGTSSTANIKTILEPNVAASDVDKGRRDKISSVPQLLTKRPAGNLDPISMTKKRALETNVESPRASNPFGKSLLSKNSSFNDLVERKVSPSFGDRSNSTLGNACFPGISDHNSPKSQPHRLMSRGTLVRSNSVNISASNRKVQLSEEEILQNLKFSGETATRKKKREGNVRLMTKSMSFNNVRFDRSKAADSKIEVLSSKFPHAEDLKRLRHAKEHNLIQMNHARKSNNTLVSSTTAGSCLSALVNDKKLTSRDQSTSPNSSGTKFHDTKAFQLNRDSNNSSKPASRLVADQTSPAMSNSSHELKLNEVVIKNEYTSSSSLSASRHRSSSDAIVQDPSPVSRESSSENEKHKMSNIKAAGKHISVGSPQTAIHEAGSPKEVEQSNKMDFGRIFHQPDVSRNLAVPKLDYIWKGGFEIQGGGRLPGFCYGIQAHLSSHASPRIPEVVNKFPRKINLEEVPRLNMWPTQFLENHPREDSIGLYFFAESLDSYRRNYKSLLEHMINYDLSLKGNFDGIELLIFPSNVLPEKSQRWNKLYYLWGVFRGRSVNDAECMPHSGKKTPIPSFNDTSSEQDLTLLAYSGFQNKVSSEKSSECLSPSKLFDNVQRSSNSIDPQELPFVSSDTRDDSLKLKLYSSDQKYFGSEACSVHRPSIDETASLSSIPVKTEQLCRDVQTNTSLKEHGIPKRRQEVSAGQSPDPMVGTLGAKSPHQQVISSDCEDPKEFEFLDLELSLGAGNKLAKRASMPSFLGMAGEKHNQGKISNSDASSRNKDGDDGESPALLKLSLWLPSHDK